MRSRLPRMLPMRAHTSAVCHVQVASLKRELAKAQADAIGARTAAARAQEEGKRAAARSSLGAAAEIALLDVHGGGGGGVGAAQAGLVVKLKAR